VPLAELVEQAFVLRGLTTFRRQGVQPHDGQFQHPGHAPQQADLVDREAVVTATGHQQVPGHWPGDRGDRRVARTGTRYVEHPPPTGDHLAQLVGGHPPAGEAHGAEDDAVLVERGTHLRLQGPGGALHGHRDGDVTVRHARDDGEELRQLLSGQGSCRRQHVSSPRGRPASDCETR
jgi:hypothetical protein